MTYDYIVKALTFDREIRAYAASTTETVQETQTKHYTWPTASAAMGRIMTATAMMGAMLKGDQKLAVTVNGQEPIERVTADVNAKGGMHAYVDHSRTYSSLNEQGKLDVKRAVGANGSIVVIKDIGMKNYFSGVSPVVSGELGEDSTYYYTTSKQIPSSVGLGVLANPDNTIKAAGGFIIQVAPGAKDETIPKLERVINEMTSVSKLIEQELTPEGLLNKILGEDHVQVLEKTPVQFGYNCSHEKFLNATKGLGGAEIQNIIKKDHGAEAICHFCGNKYEYTEEELNVLLESLA